MENKKMSMEELYQVVVDLSHSQGFYCSIKEEMEAHWDELYPILNNKFENEIDFILFLES